MNHLMAKNLEPFFDFMGKPFTMLMFIVMSHALYTLQRVTELSSSLQLLDVANLLRPGAAHKMSTHHVITM